MRGQPCPIPVVNAKKALAEPAAEALESRGSPPVHSSVVVLVDNIVAVQNLEKMAKGSGCAFSYEQDGTSFKVSITKGIAGSPAGDHVGPAGDDVISLEGSFRGPDHVGGPIVLITSDSMGRGAEELGKLLIKGFVFSLTQLNPAPEAVIFLNSGVRLTAEGANTVSDLKTLEENGTKVYSCGTCVNFYKTSLAVGSIVDMMTITNHLASVQGTAAAGIITI